jgi:hypothetical protein
MASLLTRLAQSSTSRSSSILSLSRTMSTQRATLNLKNPSLLKSKAFVNNEWVSSKSGKVFQVTNPANNEVIGEVPEMGSEEEVEEVIAVAKKAFESWRHSTPKVSLRFSVLRNRPREADLNLIFLPESIVPSRPVGQVSQAHAGQHRRPGHHHRKPLLPQHPSHSSKLNTPLCRPPRMENPSLTPAANTSTRPLSSNGSRPRP